MYKIKKLGRLKAMFLFYTFFLLLLIILLILSMKIQLQIKNLQYHSEKKQEESHLNPKYKISFCICILNKIPILKITLTKAKLKKINQKTHIKEKIEREFDKQNIKRLTREYDVKKDIAEILKNIKLKIEKINLKIELGTENVILTSFLVPVISAILAILIPSMKCKPHKQEFKVIPVYNSKNLVNFQLEGIFEIKMIHIINTICILKKKRRVEEYERTSNRRSYDYSYE